MGWKGFTVLDSKDFCAPENKKKNLNTHYLQTFYSTCKSPNYMKIESNWKNNKQR